MSCSIRTSQRSCRSLNWQGGIVHDGFAFVQQIRLRRFYGVGAVGVKPGCGVRGVLVGGRVAVGGTRFTGIFSVWPTCMAFASVRLFVFIISSVVLLNLDAIPESVSPVSTTYETIVPCVRLAGIGVGVGSFRSGFGIKICCPG